MLPQKDRELLSPMTVKNTTLPKHRVVMALAMGRPLRNDEVVHHINKDRRDNRIENLSIVSALEHGRIHHQKSITTRLNKALALIKQQNIEIKILKKQLEILSKYTIPNLKQIRLQAEKEVGIK